MTYLLACWAVPEIVWDYGVQHLEVNVILKLADDDVDPVERNVKVLENLLLILD